MPRDLGDVLDYFLPPVQPADPPPTARELDVIAPVRGPSRTRPRPTRPAALPILALPIGDDDVVHAAFAWNLAVEIARLGASATLLAPALRTRSPAGGDLWPAAHAGSTGGSAGGSAGGSGMGAELSLVAAASLGELNRAALDVAVARAADSHDSGVVFVRVPPDWLRAESEGRALLRWVLLFASPDADHLRGAYRLAKRVQHSAEGSRIGFTIHGARRVRQAESAFERLATTAQRHLRLSVVSYGLLVDDLHVYRANVTNRPIGLAHPQSRAARALRDVAELILHDARNPRGD